MDPINDIVEKFSTVLLLSLTSLGIQQFILKISQNVGTQYLLGAAASLFLLSYLLTIIISIGRFLLHKANHKVNESKSFFQFFVEFLNGSFSKLGLVFLFFFIILRFAIPVIAQVSMLSESIVMEKYEESIDELNDTNNSTNADIDVEEDNEVVQKESWWKFESPLKKLQRSVKAKIDALTGIFDKIVDLIIIFVIQTLFLPILTLFAMKSLLLPIIKGALKKTQDLSDSMKLSGNKSGDR